MSGPPKRPTSVEDDPTYTDAGSGPADAHPADDEARTLYKPAASRDASPPSGGTKILPPAARASRPSYPGPPPGYGPAAYGPSAAPPPLGSMRPAMVSGPHLPPHLQPGHQLPPSPAAGAPPPRRAAREVPAENREGPGSFSRIFLGSLEKYRAQSGDVGSATEVAATAIAEAATPDDKRTQKGATLRLRSRLALVEAVALTILFPAAGWVIHSEDPFFLNQRFSWIVFAPLLVGLRHGFAPALVSAGLLDALIAVGWRSRIVPGGLPGDTMVGLTALAMVTGQFSDVWKRELVRLDGGFAVVRKQLGELMRSYFLLELSHDRLQERTGKGAPSLRDTMLAVHRVAEGRARTSLNEISDAVVEAFQTYSMVEVAALHAIHEGVLAREALAVIGNPARIDPNDPQIRSALGEKRLTYLETGAGRERATRTALLAVVPFVDAWGKIHGILAIESMPLLAFERRNLEALAIFGSHFADVLATGGRGVHRGQRKEFEIRVHRAIRDLNKSRITSTIFALVIRKGGAVSDSIEQVLGGALRALDFPLVERDRMGNYCVYILLPATDETGARALGARVERIVRRELNMDLQRAGAFHFFRVLSPHDTVETVLRALEHEAGDG